MDSIRWMDGTKNCKPMPTFLISILVLIAVLTGMILFFKWHVKAPLSQETEVLLTWAFLGLGAGGMVVCHQGGPGGGSHVVAVDPGLAVGGAHAVSAVAPASGAGPQCHRLLYPGVFGLWFCGLAGGSAGLVHGVVPQIAAFFRPLSLVGSYVPIVVFIPLTLAWFGMSEMQKVVFLFIGCFVVLLPLVVKTVSDVPRAFLDVAKTKGATQWQLVSRVLFPIARADIWDHLRGVYGVGWGWIILAEVVNAEKAWAT